MAVNLLIDRDQQQQLARLLEECPSLQEKRTRRQILDQLHPDIHPKVDFEGPYGIVITEIVHHCAEHKDGIETLIRALANFEGKSSKRIENIWDELPRVIGFTYPEIHETITHVLEHLTDDLVSREDMAKAFNDMLSIEGRHEHGLPSARRMCRWQMLKEAEDLSQGIFPFADFMGRLSKISGPAISGYLMLWAQHITSKSPREIRRAEEDRRDLNCKPSGNPYIVVRLAPNISSIAPNKYRVTFHEHSEEGEGSPFGSDKRELEDLPIEKIEDALDGFLDDYDDEERLPRAIEVMVPEKYLTKLNPPPHLWCITRDDGRRALGQKYPVYLRLNRKECLLNHQDGLGKVGPERRREWKSAWEDFKCATSAKECIHWEDDPASCCWDAREELVSKLFGYNEDSTEIAPRQMLVMAFEPRMTTGDAWLDYALMECGTPVALWGDAKREEIEKNFLNGGSWKRLPEHIWKKRRSTVYGEWEEENPERGKKPALPHRMSLLWDDPEREFYPAESDRKPKYHYDMDLPI